jgi:hypothetical protein
MDEQLQYYMEERPSWRKSSKRTYHYIEKPPSSRNNQYMDHQNGEKSF